MADRMDLPLRAFSATRESALKTMCLQSSVEIAMAAAAF
jgi:hypothetical protein